MKLQLHKGIFRQDIRYTFGLCTNWFTCYDLYFGCYVNFFCWHCFFEIVGPKNIHYEEKRHKLNGSENY
jgi:hypothetical protein